MANDKFKNANELMKNSKDAKEFFMSSGEQTMGEIVLNSSNIKSNDDLKKFIKKV